jgi:hypothetical protein
MRRKIDFYGDIQGEAGVIMAFSKIHEALGFSKLVASTARGFDIDSIDYNSHDVTVEFEYLSSNFISHGHPGKMEDRRKYVVVCWIDDCGLLTRLKSEYGKELYDLIEIRKYVNIRKDLSRSQFGEEPLYAILAYNQDMAGGKDFSEWAFSHCYRIQTTSKTPKFATNHLPRRSKILFYQKGYIIGGFTVVRYEVIDKPKTEREWELYKVLTDYPASLFTIEISEYKSWDWLAGHIFYTDFFDTRDFKILLSHFTSKKMPRQGKMNLTKDQYYRIVGY